MTGRRKKCHDHGASSSCRDVDDSTVNLPDEDRCRELMRQYEMLPHIVEHSYRVCQIALFLAAALNRVGASLNPELVTAGSLLHDITKTRSIRTRERHAESGRELLLELGYPEVAEVVGGHVNFDGGDPSKPLSETDIVNYADKRVRHVQVVSLEDRFEDLVARYGKTEEARKRLETMKENVRRLESRIFSALEMDPGMLGGFNRISPYDLASAGLNPRPSPKESGYRERPEGEKE